MKEYDFLVFDEILLSFIVCESIDIKYATKIKITFLGNRNHFPMVLRTCPRAFLESELGIWLDNRITMIGRKLLRKIKSFLGKDSLTLLNILTITHGLSLNDAFWIRESRENTRWNDVNLYTNSFSPELEGILLSGKAIDTLQGECLSPDFTVDGRMRKSWMRDERGTFLLKADMKFGIFSQALCEWFAAQVAEAFGIPHVPYDLKFFGSRKQLACECPMFTSEDVCFVKASHVLFAHRFERGALTLQTLGNIALHHAIAHVFGVQAYEDMMVFDFLIGNIDRHLGNYGWLVDNHTGEYRGIAPVFDNGKAFFCDEPELPQNVEDWAKYEAQISTFLQPDEQITFVQPRHEHRIMQVLHWEPKQHAYCTISDHDLECLCRFVHVQCEQALKFLERGQECR